MNATQAFQEVRPDAVVWIDERRAIVAQRDPAGGISTTEIRRLQRPEARFLGEVVHEIGSHEHVMVIGAQPIRLGLERRFVAVTHRPERLIASSPAVSEQGAAIVDGLSRLAA